MQINCKHCSKALIIPLEKLNITTPTARVKCPACGGEVVFTIPGNAQKTQVQGPKEESGTYIDVDLARKVSTQTPVLINKATGKTYNLQPGINTIGRNGTIALENDGYISRHHCSIEVIEKTGTIQLVLVDDGSTSPDGNPSTNGVFYNQSPTRLNAFDKIVLHPNDAICIGRTDFTVTY